MFKDKLDKLAKQRASGDSVDKMIDRAKSMRPKPFKREPDYPDKPEKAANDATATKRRKLDNVLPTMDKHGVSDIVRNLGRK